MKKIVAIDGNSIMNRAFYGIMNSKMLMAADGTFTNAIFGFLSILFKLLNEENPDYILACLTDKYNYVQGCIEISACLTNKYNYVYGCMKIHRPLNG